MAVFVKHSVPGFLHRGGELYQKSWTKAKSNDKEQQFTGAPAGAAVRFVQFGSEPRGKRAYPRRRRQHVEICSKWCRRGILPAGIYFMRLPDSGSGGETVVEVPGFEPGQAEPKSVVLPLHHTSVRATKIRIIYAYPQKYLCILIGRGLPGMPPRQRLPSLDSCRGGIPEGLQHWGRSIIW